MSPTLLPLATGYTAAVDVPAGVGLLACPSDDWNTGVRDPDPLSLTGPTIGDAALGAVLTDLCSRGVEPTEDETGGLGWAADLPDGRRLLALRVLDPVVRELTDEHLFRAVCECWEALDR